MGWAFTGVTLPRLSTVRASLEVVRLRELTLVFILTLFAGRVTVGKREVERGEKRESEKGEGAISLSPAVFLDLPPLSKQ